MKYTYTGKELDAGTGLMYYRARYYDPVLGRFLSADPLPPVPGAVPPQGGRGVPEPGNPQSLNRYAYVYNNPLKYTDPSGHWLETVWDIANIAWDIHEIRQDPGNLWNWGALVVDVGAALLPVVPAGAGMVVHGGKAAKAAVEAASHGDEVVDAGRVVAEIASHADEAAEALRRIPLGFKNADEFAQFGARLKGGLENAGYEGVQAIFQGSSVTGVKYTTGAPFDVGRVSDFDIALASPTLLQRAKELGIGLRGGGTRTGPLTDEQLQMLGLLDLTEELSRTAGRPVKFMIYESIDAAVKRGPSILVP